MLQSYKEDQNLDYFYKVLEANKYPSLSLALQVFFVLFHKQAEVERGFSLNYSVLAQFTRFIWKNLNGEGCFSERLVSMSTEN